MSIRDIQRRILNTQLRMARVPVDVAERAFNRGADKAAWAPRLAYDSAEAAIKDTVGSVLGDDALRQDAALQRAKVAELREAGEKLAEAERIRAEADAAYRDRTAQAERQRQDAERQAVQEKARVEQERQTKKRQVSEETARKKAAAQNAAAAREDRIRQEETKDRLKAAAAEAEALDAKQEELAIREEADRLEKAAAAVRTRRNGTPSSR